MRRALAQKPVVALALVVAVTPTCLPLVVGDVGEYGWFPVGRAIALCVTRFGHRTIVGGAWIHVSPGAGTLPIEEAHRERQQ